MNKPRLLSNLPIEDLTSETDYLGIIDKGDLIKEFLKGNKDQFDEIKMFSLYGEWGSGKSSLMKYLEKELKGEFNTFFFEAWEFEKDENLAMSLLEYITSKHTDSTEELCNDLLKYGGRILRGLGKSVKLNIPLFPNGPGIELDPSAFVEEVTDSEELTFLKALESFKTEFKRLEDKITVEGKPKYNIVFIDDLDRCEPEQVLNLLSAIKLFFTYGEKTIFFCGIDKKAVEQAVKTKYGKVVKANEYLEKIFDISFSMPEHDNLLKLINHYFDDTVYNIGSSSITINKRISDYFYYLRFTNPRRVKKVLNKLQIFRNIKKLKINNPFPNIDENNGKQENFFETILVLYLILLHEFYPESYSRFANFENKKINYIKTIENENTLSENNKNVFNDNLNLCFNENYSEIPLNELPSDVEIDQKFSICLSPLEIKNISYLVLYDFETIRDMPIIGNAIETLFYKYVFIQNIDLLINDKLFSSSSISGIKKMINKVL